MGQEIGLTIRRLVLRIMIRIPSNTPPVDADSNPNSNTPTENGVTPGSPDDNNINGGGPLL